MIIVRKVPIQINMNIMLFSIAHVQNEVVRNNKLSKNNIFNKIKNVILRHILFM